MRDFHFPGRSAVFAENGICATSHPLASMVAIDTLKSGGNAVDAAIAGALMLTLCEPHMCGIGGDCFALFSPAGSDDILALNGSGRAPAALSADALRAAGHDTIPLRSAAAVTIPGAIDAFCTLANDYGVLGIDRLCAPTIDYAKRGVPVAPRVATDWAAMLGDLHETALPFYTHTGQAPKLGAIFANPTLADVLSKVAQQGRDGFYASDVAQDMVDTLSELGGVHGMDDFQNNRADYTDPISAPLGDKTLFEHPPNGQGATAFLISNILANFDLANMDPIGADRVHIEAEAAKLAYDARNRILADPDHTTRLDRMVSQKLADELAALIDPKTARTDIPQLTEAVHKDTVYITVVDRDRMAVSLIFSIFHGFGSGIASRKYGILMQNRGAGFNLTPDHPNMATGGKRPMHTIIPGMLAQNGKPYMPFGVMGGQYQPMGHIRVLGNMMTYGMDIQSAIDAPRSFPEGGVLKLERGFSDVVASDLAARGHVVDHNTTPIGGAQAIIMHDTGVLEGASDPRKDGCALGY